MKTDTPKLIQLLLKTEYLLLFIFFLYLVSQHSLFSWWIVLLFWFPDIAFIGYLLGGKIGSYLYNFTHYFGIGVVIFFLGMYINNEFLTYLALIQLAHINFDRLFGYGLKYPGTFKKTHLKEL